MSDAKRRLGRLEMAIDKQAPELPLLWLVQDRSDPDVYHGGPDGQTLTRADVDELQKRNRVICFVYADVDRLNRL